MNAPGVLPLKNQANAWVPLDDENTMVWQFGPQRTTGLDPDAKGVGGLKVGVRQTTEKQGRYDPYPARMGGQRVQLRVVFDQENSGWLGKFRPLANKHNDYLIDREFQAAIEWDPTQADQRHLLRRPRPGAGPDGAGEHG